MEKNQLGSSINHYLNSIKGIACLGVVLIHIKFPGIIGEIFWVLGQFAVPLFFMISGYYMPDRKKAFADIKIKKKIGHIGKITIWSVLIYGFYFYIRGGVKQVKWNSKIFFKMIILQDFDFLGAGHLWFLPALLYMYVLYYADLKLNLKRENKVYFLIPLLFLLRIIVPAFSGYSWHWRGNFLVTGVPYFLIGRFLAEYKIIFSKITVKNLYTVLYMGFIFAVLQVFISCKINIFDLGIMLASTALFLLAQKTPDSSIYFFENFGEKYSLYIYVMHILTANLIDMVASLWKVKDLMFYSWGRPIIVIMITIIISLIFDYIRNNIISFVQKKRV